MKRVSVLNKWLLYQEYENLELHERCRQNSFRSMITRLVNSTNMGNDEFYTTKSEQELIFWQFNEKLLSEIRPYEIFEHSGQWFGDWSQAYFSLKTGAAIEFKLPEIYLALNEQYREKYFKLAQENNLNTFLAVKDGDLERFSKQSYEFNKENGPSKELLDASSNTDLFKISGEKIYFLELKKREDSGGGTAKQELKDKAKKIILSILRNETVWFYRDTEIKIRDLLNKHKINHVKIGFGIFYKKDGTLFPDDYVRRSNTHQKQLYTEIKNMNFENLTEKYQEVKIFILNGGNLKINVPSTEETKPIEIAVEYFYGNNPFYWFIGEEYKMNLINISQGWIDFQYTIEIVKKEREFSILHSKYQHYNNFCKIINFLEKMDKKILSLGYLEVANEILRLSEDYNSSNQKNSFTLDNIDDVVKYIFLLCITNYLEIQNGTFYIKNHYSKREETNHMDLTKFL